MSHSKMGHFLKGMDSSFHSLNLREGLRQLLKSSPNELRPTKDNLPFDELKGNGWETLRLLANSFHLCHIREPDHKKSCLVLPCPALSCPGSRGGNEMEDGHHGGCGTNRQERLRSLLLTDSSPSASDFCCLSNGDNESSNLRELFDSMS